MGTLGRRTAFLFAVAVQLLTRFPVRLARVDDDDLRDACALYPAVGVLVAATGIAVRVALGPLLGAAPATVAAVAAMVAATGAFHEDGLADTADGLWGGWSPDRRVEIMRDSRVGTYGAAALVLALAFQVALLTPLAAGPFAVVVLAGHVVGRAAGVAVAATLAPVADQGLGAKVIGPVGPVTAATVAASAGAATALAAGAWLAVPLAVAALAVLGVRELARRKLGGLTGDILGATNQLAQLGSMAALVALHRHGLA